MLTERHLASHPAATTTHGGETTPEATRRRRQLTSVGRAQQTPARGRRSSCRHDVGAALSLAPHRLDRAQRNAVTHATQAAQSDATRRTTSDGRARQTPTRGRQMLSSPQRRGGADLHPTPPRPGSTQRRHTRGRSSAAVLGDLGAEGRTIHSGRNRIRRGSSTSSPGAGRSARRCATYSCSVRTACWRRPRRSTSATPPAAGGEEDVSTARRAPFGGPVPRPKCACREGRASGQLNVQPHAGCWGQRPAAIWPKRCDACEARYGARTCSARRPFSSHDTRPDHIPGLDNLTQ